MQNRRFPILRGFFAVLIHPVKNLRASFRSYFASAIFPTIFWTFFALIMMEMGIAHLLIGRIQTPWIRHLVHTIFILSDIGVCEFLFGYLYYLQYSYVRLTPAALEIKLGIKWQIHIPLDQIHSITRLDGLSTEPAAIKIALMQTPQLRIELKNPLLSQFFLKERAIKIIHLWVKDEDLDALLNIKPA